MERVTRPAELRAEGRRLSGTVLRYGEVSPSFREQFAPGSLHFDTVTLNRAHAQMVAVAAYPNYGLTLEDSPDALTMTAILMPAPASDETLADVRAGKLRGLSIEFRSESEYANSGGLRIIERAKLVGIGVVQEPAYPSSGVEARQRNFARGRVRPNRTATCRCISEGCQKVRYERNAFDGVIAAAQSGEVDIVATIGDFVADHLLGSTRAGSLIIDRADDGGLAFSLAEAAAGTMAATALASTAEAAPAVARPLVDQDASEFEERQEDGETVRVYSAVALTGLLLKWTRDASGWEAVNVTGTAERSARRGGALWL